MKVSLYEYFFDKSNTNSELYPTMNDVGFNKGGGPKIYVDPIWKLDFGQMFNLNIPYLSYGQIIPAYNFNVIG